MSYPGGVPDLPPTAHYGGARRPSETDGPDAAHDRGGVQ